MNLRSARFDDHWRRALSRQYPTSFREISLRGVASVADCTIRFTSGISAIIGSNGVGKSTIVAAISELLSSGTVQAVGHRDRLDGSELSGVARRGTGECRLHVIAGQSGERAHSGDRFGGEFRWLDPSDMENSILHQIHLDRNFGDLLEPLSALHLEPEELKLASYLVNRNYEDLHIFEISDYGNLDPFPYFRARSSGAEYGSEEMGRGELVLLLTYWTLRDLAPSSILVIEEPETHVSPRSQDSLMNVLAKFSDEESIWIIIATHSPTIIRRLPREHVKMLSRSSGRSVLIENPTRTEIAAILGGGISYRAVALVEDGAAKEFLFLTLEDLAPDLLRQFEIVSAKSESGITAALSAMPLGLRALSIIGIYDGDMRNRLAVEGIVWPHAFLPGEIAPDEMLLQVLQDAESREAVAAEIHKTEVQLTVALDNAAGVDPHDRVAEISKMLGLSASVLRRGMFHVWISNEENRRQTLEFVRQIENSANASA